MLQPGLISNEVREEIWKRGKRKNTYYVGFLQQTPNDLPIEMPAHKQWQLLNEKLQSEVNQGNEIAELLILVLSPSGQAFLQIAELVLNKPNDQDAVAIILNSIGQYFNKFNAGHCKWRDIHELAAYANDSYHTHEEVRKILVIDNSLESKLKALFILFND